jgi:ABC-type sugar transport system ATPase subunit
MEHIVEFKDISKSYAGVQVLSDIKLEVNRSDFMVIYGIPSSGKSVLMRLLVGLERPDSGRIILRGTDVSEKKAKKRNIGYVPQDFALYPHKDIYENIAYPLRLMKKPSAQIKPIVQRAVEMVHIEDLLHKLPTQLSGGQKQRVAIARGIVKETDIYLFDDPLAGLDFKLREELIDDLKELQTELDACFIYTTSDSVEALTLASKVAVLHDCCIRETGEPEAVYVNPKFLSTMEILGFPRTNFLKGALFSRSDQLWCKTDLFEFQVVINEIVPIKKSTKVMVGIRPEYIRATEENGMKYQKGKVHLREDLGGEDIIYLDVGGARLIMVMAGESGRKYDVDDIMHIEIDGTSLYLFDGISGKRIGRGTGNPNV